MYSLDAAVNSTLMRLKYGIPFAENLKEFFLPLIPSDIAAVLAALGTAYVTVVFGPAAALVLFAGAAAALISLHLIHKHQRESEELKKENAELLASGVELAAGIVESVGAKDGYTARLAAASSVFAGDIAGEFGLDAERTKKLRIAALLQDVGLVSVPDEALLAAPGKLNSVGRMQFERHTVQSEGVLSKAPGFEEAAKWARWHHERMDGTGYPDRLKGQWIPLEARILAVAETYSSMVLAGPHNPALPPQEARMELTSLAERSLDIETVKALLRVLDREDANYATAADSRFAFTSPAREDEGGSFSPRVVGEESG
ncbi:MAG: HD-GYP domain-containing protein [Rubrobacteraceae bacterium]